MFRRIWRRHPDLNRGIKVLQTSALPLGYGAAACFVAAYCHLKYLLLAILLAI